MTAPTTPGAAPSSRPRYSGRTILVAALVAVLTLSTVVGVGWLAFSDRRAGVEAIDILPYAVPEPGWQEGSVREWSATVASDAEVLTAGSTFLTLERSQSADPAATLTAYAMSDEGLSQQWSRQVDLSQGTPGNPEFVVWNDSTLVHGSTLVDLATGESSTAPWPEDAVPHATDDMILTCDDSDNCSGWRHGETTSAWSLEVAGTSSTHTIVDADQRVHERGENRYVRVGTKAIVNMDTGEQVRLDIPEAETYGISVAIDGWVVLTTDGSGDNEVMYAYDVEGGEPVDSYPSQDFRQGDQTLLYTPSPWSRDTYRQVWADRRTNLVTAIADTPEWKCTTAVHVTSGASITLPELSNGPSTTLSEDSTVCLGGARLNGDGSLVTVSTEARLDSRSALFMYRSSSGEQVAFEGVDPATGGRLFITDPSTILGYDPGSGTVYSFAPKE